MAQDNYGNQFSDSDFRSMVERQDNFEAELRENTQATKRIEANTAELVEFFSSAKGAFKVLNMIGSLAKPIGYIAAAVAGVIGAWAAFKSGIGPK